MREERRDEPSETFGPYVLYECLGRGGMATVHRAKKQGIEGISQPVALKRMLPWLSADADFVKSFVREARVAAHLRHTNIAQTYDLGRVDGVYYIAMELVAGRDLREILRQAHNVAGPPPVSVVIYLLFQICDGLDYAHTFRDEQGRPLGLVHRDISPANIIVGDDGTAKIVDFGVAKGTTNTLATQSGMLKGKFSYMAPEMLKGQTDARSDLFAAGIVAWELLTAKPLFSGGDDMEILGRIASWDPPAPSTINPAVPVELDAWLAMALAKDPLRRFQSAAQMRAGLELVARTPQMRASAADVAGWVAWAYQEQRPARRPSAPAPVGALAMAPIDRPAVAPNDQPALTPRPPIHVVDDPGLEFEAVLDSTAVGAAPAPPGRSSRTPGASPSARPSTSPPFPASGVPVPIGPSQTGAIPAPIVVAPSGPIPMPIGVAGSSAIPAAAAAVARTVLYDPGGPSPGPGSGPALGPAPTLMMTPPSTPPQATTQSMSPLSPQFPPTQAMVLPPMPPGAMDVPLSAIAPTISPDAGIVAPRAVNSWEMAPRGAPEQMALRGDDLRGRPEYMAATAAYQAAVDLINPAPRGTPGPQAVVEGRRSRPHSAAGPTVGSSSGVGMVLVIALCAAAAVGGFFVVQHLM